MIPQDNTRITSGYTKLPAPLLTELMVARSQGAPIKELVSRMPKPNRTYLSGILHNRLRKRVPGPRAIKGRPLSREEKRIVLAHVIAASKGDVTPSPEMQAIEDRDPRAAKRSVRHYRVLLERLHAKAELTTDGHRIWKGGFEHVKRRDGSIAENPRQMDGPNIQLSPLRLFWDLEHEVPLRPDQRLRPCRVFGRLCVNPTHAQILKGTVVREEGPLTHALHD